MKESERSSLPRFDSLDELVNFFDTHDLGEFDEQMEEVDFEVDLKRKKWLLSLDGGVARKLTEIAKQRQMSSDALANAWLMEKINEQPSLNQQGA